MDLPGRNQYLAMFICFELLMIPEKVMLISMSLDICSKLGCVVAPNRVLLNFCFSIKLFS